MSESQLESAGWSRYAPALGLCILLLGCLAYGYSLDRYPAPYVDDVVFAYPALQQLQGGPFAYPGGGAMVPYATQVWAYHGPVLPNLNLVAFKLFGYHFALSRALDFFFAWAAALLLVFFLKRQGYRWAGLLFAVAWCGGRANQEVMYDRMEGLGLFCLVLLFLLLRRFWTASSSRVAFLCGLLAGFSILVHPLCAFFGLLALLLVLYRGSVRNAAPFFLGGIVNVPLLLVLWRFHPVEAWKQFFFVATALGRITGTTRSHEALFVLRWSKYWVVAVLALAVICAAGALVALLRRQVASFDPMHIDLELAGLFCAASLALLAKSSLFPYYIVYVSAWPLLCASILCERYWKRFRFLALVLLCAWGPSAVWDLLRLREAFLFHAQLSHRFIDNELRRDVPSGATVLTSSALYEVPVEDGYLHRGLLDFDPHRQNICPSCYLLLTRTSIEDNHVAPSNLDRRTVLYSGPAFPHAGLMLYPVVLYSPEHPAPPQPERQTQPQTPRHPLPQPQPAMKQ